MRSAILTLLAMAIGMPCARADGPTAVQLQGLFSAGATNSALLVDSLARAAAQAAANQAGQCLPLAGGTLAGSLTMGGGNLVLQNGYSIGIGDTGGTTTYAFSGGAGKLSLVSTSGAIELSLTSIVATGKVYLDSSHSMWIAESGGKVLIGTGGSDLASIDASGNVRAAGTITGSVTP